MKKSSYVLNGVKDFNFTDADVVFGWYEGYKNNFDYVDTSRWPEPMNGPYYNDSVALIGSSPWHSKEDILKTWVGRSKTRARQIEKARPGTVIDCGHYHSCANFLIRRMLPEEIKEIRANFEIKKKVADVEERIKQQTESLQKIKSELLKEQRLIQKSIKKKLGIEI